jgi:hypothetical protein
MSRVSAEIPSKAQHSCAGTDSPKPLGGGFATTGGAVRMAEANGTLAGCTLLSFTAAFIGESAIGTASFPRPG